MKTPGVRRLLMGVSASINLSTLALLSCVDVRLDPIQDEAESFAIDNKLAIAGEFCTSPPADVDFPVKVMFIVDGSGSMQFSDQNRQRVVAVEETINRLVGQASVSFKTIVFNASISATPSNAGDPPPPVFSNQLSVLLPGLINLAEADTVTDYQGALAVAFSELQRDIGDALADSNRGRAELARTKYVLIFISDGLPDPQCSAGLGNDFDPNFPGGVNFLCENQNYINCLLEVPAAVNPPGASCGFGDGAPCDASCGDTVCNFDGQPCFRVEDASTLFGGLNNAELASGQDYNQPYQILQKVTDIMELQERFDVGSITVHAGLVLDPQADPAAIEIFGDPLQAAPLVRQVAEIGQGEYLEFYSGDDISFLSLNFDALKQSRVIRAFFAENTAVHRAGNRADSDFDGLSDAVEIEFGTSPFVRDTDNDGFRDYLEWLLDGRVTDANDPCLPQNPLQTEVCLPDAPIPICDGDLTGFFDTDGDGLLDCEERLLGLNPRGADSDRDGIPDGVELSGGLDPSLWDTQNDLDLDGLSNGDELMWHLDPRSAQGAADSKKRYRYTRSKSETLADGRSCFSFEVDGLELIETRPNDDLPQAGSGFNDIRLYIIENTEDNLSGSPIVRTACIRARYLPPALKRPEDGIITLSDEDFKYYFSEDPIFNQAGVISRLFDPDVDCDVPPATDVP